jgi:hypothetical protein
MDTILSDFNLLNGSLSLHVASQQFIYLPDKSIQLMSRLYVLVDLDSRLYLFFTHDDLISCNNKCFLDN